MDDFYHSQDANNILHLFYRADVMVYVEGEDDVPFWEIVFSHLADYKVEIQDVGGSNELEKYIAKLDSGEINGIVACDSDFEVIKGYPSKSNVIRTYGYSIENTIISQSTILKIIKSIGKIPTKNTPVQESEEWLKKFNSTMQKLVIHDIYNELKGLGVSIVGDNCSRFLKSQKSYELCQEKIEDFIRSVGFLIEESDLQKIDTMMNEISRDYSDFIRGHFLFSAVSRFIITTI
ncbi:DUF4435 domain-containing protein, partial [Vibrio cholerae]